MNKKLLCLGIVLIPFYEVLVLLFFPLKEISFVDTRIHKEVLSLNIALLFSVLAFYKGFEFKLKNKWILGFILMTVLSMNVAPDYTAKLGIFDFGGVWCYKALAHLLAYFIFFLCISSIEWSSDHIDIVLSFMMYTALAMGIYVILQYFSLDQFYHQNPTNPDKGNVTQEFLGGNLGQPTLVAPFIAMIIPIMFYFRKYVYIAFMILVVCLINSNVATGAMCIGISVYLWTKIKWKWFVHVVVLAILCSAITYGFMSKKLSIPDGSGRYTAWVNIVKDVNKVPFAGKKLANPYTGHGPGSYIYAFPQRYNSTFKEAHNEPLEVLHDMGIGGLFLMIMAIGSLLIYALRTYFNNNCRASHALFGSFLIICLCSLGTFVFQLAVYKYFTVIIIGLITYLHQEEEYARF